jgi:hypothetical protein
MTFKRITIYPAICTGKPCIGCLRFQFALAAACDLGHDAIHAAEISLHRATDSEIMAQAKEDAQMIVTTDLDYPRLFLPAGSIEARNASSCTRSI